MTSDFGSAATATVADTATAAATATATAALAVAATAIDLPPIAEQNPSVSSIASPRGIVIGAGLVGSAIAYELAGAGLEITVLERSVPGAEASSVAAGILAPRIEHRDGPLLDLGLASLAVHARWAGELRAIGLESGHRESGALSLAMGSAELAALEESAKRHDARLLDAAELRALEPQIGPLVEAGLLLPHEGQVEPPRLLRALALAAEARGARFLSGIEVRNLARRGERVVGVSTGDGTVIEADFVVIAAGSWTGLLPGLPEGLRQSVRPVRGQLVHLDTRRPIVSRVLFGGGGYVVPRLDGRVIIGATMEEAGFDKTVTLGGAHAVMSRALSVVPAFAQAELVSHAVNFRPASADELPLIGATESPGLFMASGHFRNGILLAPATAEMLCDLILERAPRHPSGAFDPRRFRGKVTA
jgi:glycine oxidase